MESFKFRRHGDSFGMLESNDISGYDHLLVPYARWSVNFHPRLNFDAVQWVRPSHCFERFDISSWDSNSVRQGAYRASTCPLPLKPSQIFAPLDLRVKKSFHIESITSGLSTHAPIVSLPSPSKCRTVAAICETASSPHRARSTVARKKDHAIENLLPPSLTEASDNRSSISPLNLTTGSRRETPSNPPLETVEDDGAFSPAAIDQPLVSSIADATRPADPGPPLDRTDDAGKPGSEDVAKNRERCQTTIRCQHLGCHKTFHSRGAMTIHAHRFHSTGTEDKDEIGLQVNAKRCQQQQQQQQHQRQKQQSRRPREKPTGKNLQCSHAGCGKSFREMKHLKVHQMQHTDDRPLACALCSYKCRQRNSMNWHMKAKHGHDKKVTQDGRTIYLPRHEPAKEIP